MTKLPRVAIAGARTWSDLSWAIQGILYALEVFGITGDFILVTGRCDGADAIGEHIVRGWGYKVDPHKALWNKYGKRAGPIRNATMCKISDFVILLWEGVTRGTSDMFNHCKAKWGEEGSQDHVFHWYAR